MGAVPPHQRGRDRPGLSVNSHPAETLWPIAGSSTGGAAGTTVYHLLPHIKGTTPDRDVTPTESEFAGSEQEGSGQEEGEITQTEGDEPGSFTQMRSKDSDSGSDDTTAGRDSWRSARGQETPRVGVNAGRSEEEALRSDHGWSRRCLIVGTGRRSPDPAAPGTDQGGAASGPLDPVHRRAGLPLPALVHAGARGLLRVRAGTYGACPLPPKVTEGRPIPDQSAEMSTDGAPVVRH